MGADTISNISELSKDKWKQVKATFTAQGEYLVLTLWRWCVGIGGATIGADGYTNYIVMVAR